MQSRHFFPLVFVFIGLVAAASGAEEPTWTTLFDGRTLDGWRAFRGTASVADGQLVLPPDTALECMKGQFADFELTAGILAEAGANGAIVIQNMSEAVAPLDSIRVPVNNSRQGSLQPKTGSLAGFACLYKSPVEDGRWFTLRIHAQDGRVRVWVDGACTAESPGWRHGFLRIETEKGSGKIRLKDVRTKMLPLDPKQREKPPRMDDIDRLARELREKGIPFINYHIHLKGDLTLEKALAHSREIGVFYGIAANCGLNFPITDDRGIDEYVRKLEGRPCFIGMQAEGREWPTLFSKEAVARFDYVFSDAMTIVDHRGKRARLWMPDEVDIPDKQAFMERLVRTIEGILDNEPIDIYANPTYLPDVIVGEYDALWTAERVKRVIDAAARNGVAIEISNRLQLPKADFIRQAKKAGCKFSVGTNNVDSKLGRGEYALRMIRECGLTAGDMFLPKPDGRKPIQVRGFKGKAEPAK